MTITVPTREELRETLQATLKGLLPAIVVTKDSDAGVRIDMLIEALFGVHRQVKTLQDDQFVSDRTSTEALELHANARLTGGRKGATLAGGTDLLTVTGTLASVVTAGDLLNFEDGTEYQITTGGAIPAALSLLVSLQAITPGIVGNRDVGEILTFITPPVGINANATVTTKIAGGEDQETDGELIARLLDVFKNPPAGGQFSDYRRQAQSIEGVLTAYTYGPSSVTPTGRRGLGFIDVAILGRGTAGGRVPTAVVQQNVVDEIESKRPASTRDFNVFLPTTVEQDIEALITPEPGSEFDWTKIAAVLVDSYVAATATIITDDEVADFASASATRTLKVGDRVLVGVGGGAGSEIGMVKSILPTTPAAKSTIEFEAAFVVAPVAGDNFEPGGPLTEPLLTAAKDYFDGLGPARGTAPDPEQVWDDTLRVNKLAKVLFVPGTKDVAIASPGDVPSTDNVTPTDPGGTTPPNLLIYGELNLHPPIGV